MGCVCLHIFWLCVPYTTQYWTTCPTCLLDIYVGHVAHVGHIQNLVTLVDTTNKLPVGINEHY